MPELLPFTAVFPTQKLIASAAGFPAALGGVSLSRAYGDGLLLRSAGEAFYRVEIEYADEFGERRTRREICGIVRELRRDRQCVAIENATAGPKSARAESPLPAAVRGIYFDRAETLRALLEPRRAEPPLIETSIGTLKCRVSPVSGPAAELVKTTLRRTMWYLALEGKFSEGAAFVSLSNWYSSGTAFDSARRYEGDAKKAADALRILRQALRDDYLVRDYPCDDGASTASALREAKEDLRFETATLPAFAAFVPSAKMLHVFIGRKPLAKPSAGFFSLSKPCPLRIRVQREVVNPVLAKFALKASGEESRAVFTLFLPRTRPEEYAEFAAGEFGAALDVAPHPPSRDLIYPEEFYGKG
jgi:hypothetical protein